MRARAIKNWKKLRLLIVLLIICGKSFAIPKTEDEPSKEIKDDEEEKKGCRAKFAPYIINPSNKYKLAWDLVIAIFLLFSYFMDPLVNSFWFRPYESNVVINIQYFVTCIFLINSIITPFTGIERDDNNTEI